MAVCDHNVIPCRGFMGRAGWRCVRCDKWFGKQPRPGRADPCPVCRGDLRDGPHVHGAVWWRHVEPPKGARP